MSDTLLNPEPKPDTQPDIQPDNPAPQEAPKDTLLSGDDLSWVPDKSYIVHGEDGKVDLRAMAEKAIKRHRDAEALLQKKGLDVPKKADEYTLEGLPEGFTVPEDMLKAFHEAGMTHDQVKKQVAYLAEKFIPEIENQRMAVEMHTLKSTWGYDEKTDAEFELERDRVSAYAIEKFGMETAAQIASNAKGMDALRGMMRADKESSSVNIFSQADRLSSKETPMQRYDEMMIEARKIEHTDPIKSRYLQEQAYKIIAG